MHWNISEDSFDASDNDTLVIQTDRNERNESG